MNLGKKLSAGLIISMILPAFSLASSTSPISNANVNVDFAYKMIEDHLVDDISDYLEHNDGDAAPAMEMDPEDENKYLVLGLKTPFDEVYFDVDNPGHFEERSFDWEYNDGGTWRSLSLDADTTDDFESSGVSRIEFDLPNDWDTDSIEGDTAYWIRYGGHGRMDESPAFEQVSMRAYNLEFDLEDDDDDAITTFNESDFTVDRGSDDTVYGFSNRGNGVYWLALNGDSSDTNYTVTIEDYRFHERSIDTASLSSSLNSYGVTLYELDDDDDDDDDDYDRDDEDEDADYDVNDDRELIDGATADFDYVYHRGKRTINYSDEASENDNDHVEVFRDSSGTQYLYLGMRTVFDEIYFDIDEEIEWDGSSDLDWEYYSDDDGWEDLDVDDKDLDDFEDEGDYMVDFDIPRDWEESRFEGRSAYWVRVRARYAVDQEAEVDQISARAYTIQIEVEDDDNDEVDNLRSSNFDLSKGSDNKIYGFINEDDGEYLLAVNLDASDINYELTIDHSDYYEEEISVRPRTSQSSYDVELRERSRRSNSSTSSSYNSYNSYNYDDCESPFRDVRYHWSRYSVEELYCLGIVEGKSRYVFSPNSDVSRAEFLKMLLEVADIDLDDYEDDSESFRDVREYDWYYEYVVAAVELDVIRQGSYFNPNSDINRAEAVTMMTRLAEFDLDERNTRFTDVSSRDWFSAYIRSAYDANLVNGYRNGKFRPHKNLSRAEAAEMIMNAYEENIW